MKSIILHIGRHKTGTTALQGSFVNNQSTLRRAGINYPEHGVRENAHHLIAERLNPRRLAEDKQDFMSDPLITSFIDALDACDQPTILISSEAFQNCRPEDVGRLFSHFDVTVVFYIRDQISYLKSAYLQEVHATNYSGSLEEFEENRFVADYLDFYERWESVFSSEKIIVRPYARKHMLGNDIVTDFFRSVLEPCLGKTINYEIPQYDGFTANASLKGLCIPFKLRLNGVAKIDQTENAILYQALGRFSQQVGGSSSIIDKSLGDKVARKYIESNTKLMSLLSWDSDLLVFENYKNGVPVQLLDGKGRHLLGHDLVDVDLVFDRLLQALVDRSAVLEDPLHDREADAGLLRR